MGKFSLVSADSHVCEPADLWLKYIDPKFRERAPRIRRDDLGEDSFFCDGVRLLGPARFSRAGKPGKGWGKTLADVYPGGYDPRARLKEIAVDGVEAEVLYPSVAMRLYELPDPEMRRACFAAYNSWIADFCRACPETFKALGMIDLDDVDLAVAEAKRVRALGLPGVMITVEGDDPSLYATDSHGPFWAAVQEMGMPVSLHVITGMKPMPVFNHVNEIFISGEAERSLVTMIFSGLFFRFPRLKVVSAENEAGWAIYLLERMDWLFQRENRRVNQDYPIKDLGVLPSEYFRRNIAMTFIWDKSAPEARRWVGVDNLMWSNDYPHDASSWPHSRAVLDDMFRGVPKDEVRKIVAGNAERLYGF